MRLHQSINRRQAESTMPRFGAEKRLGEEGTHRFLAHARAVVRDDEFDARAGLESAIKLKTVRSAHLSAAGVQRDDAVRASPQGFSGVVQELCDDKLQTLRVKCYAGQL